MQSVFQIARELFRRYSRHLGTETIYVRGAKSQSWPIRLARQAAPRKEKRGHDAFHQALAGRESEDLRDGLHRIRSSARL